MFIKLAGDYALVFAAYGVGALLGPLLAGGVWSYRWAFLSAAAGCLAAMVLAAIVRPPRGEDFARRTPT